jgi:hypothetical protein
MLQVILFCLSIILLTGCGHSDYQKAELLEKRLESGDKTALAELDSLVTKNPWAAVAAGRAHQIGLQTKVDIAEAMYDYSLAQKLPQAWYNAGLIYSQFFYSGLPSNGSNEPPNACFSASGKSPTQKAVDCLAHTSETSDVVQARIALGMIYKQGKQDVLSNLPHACEYFRKAAEDHDDEGRYQFGICQLTGRGAQKDVTSGVRYLIEAAKNEHVGAIRELAIFFRQQNDLPKSAFWLILLAEDDPSTKPIVRQALAAYPANVVGKAENSAKSWVAAHGTNHLARYRFEQMLPVSVQNSSD